MVGRHPAPGASSAHAHLRGRSGLTGFTAASLAYAPNGPVFTDTPSVCSRSRWTWGVAIGSATVGAPGAGRALRGQRLSRWRLTTSCHLRPWLRLFNPPLVDSANSLQSRRAHHAACGAERQCDWSETESVVALIACERPETLFVGATRTVKSGQ